MKILFTLSIILLTGCATKLTVTSTPEGARMSFKGKEYTTPFVISYANLFNRDIPYALYKENYQSKIGELPSEGGHVNIRLIKE